MSFISISSFFKLNKDNAEAEEQAFSEKLYSAEKNIGLLRILVINLSAVVYFIIPLHNPIPWLEYSIIIVSNLYSFYVYFAEPYKKHKLFFTSLFTTVLDAGMISLNIIATGGFESPFYLVWLVALTSVAYRYTFKVTVRTTFIYALVYFLIMISDVPFTDHVGDIILRIGFILIHGFLVGYISEDFLDLINSKLMLEKAQKELQKKEMVYNDAQQLAHVGSWEWDIENNLLTWSDEMYRIYGYKPGEKDVTLNTYLSHACSDDFDIIWNIIKGSVENNTEFDHYFKIIDCKGSIKFIHSVGKPIIGARGEVSRILATCYDVTRQKRAEEELRKSQVQLEERVKERTRELKQANLLLHNEIKMREEVEEKQKELIMKLNVSNEELQRTNEDIDNFVYSASHDLKSPVLNIEALVDLLNESEGSEDVEFVADVRRKLNFSLTRMKSTIENISNIARAQKQVFEDFEKIDFQSVLSEVLDENEEVIKASKAKVFDNFVSDYDFICSRNCIKSILYNFLTNAIKYRHPDRHPEIFISTCLKDDTYCFSVKDNGLGIDLERHRHKLFGIFKRFHDHVEGTGIGLYMVKRMVEKNQGRIEVDSIPGCGTVFTVIFPLQFRKEKKMSEFQRL